MPSLRPTASRGRSAAGWIQIVLHRYRGIRWIAAACAAIAAFTALNSNSSDDPANVQLDSAAMLQQAQTAARLPVGTRGIAVPNASAVFAPGDRVDVHEIRTGAAVVHSALVVEVTDDDTIIAVDAALVDALVDALTEGGVILALVPLTPAAI